eukprot:5319010-Amphidinium_carterae.1
MEVRWQWQCHDARRFTCAAEILMACGDIVWAMRPNPPRSDCLACEYLLRLALWHRHTVPVCEGEPSECGKLAKLWLPKLWLQLCRVVGFGIAVEQLAMSSSW